MTRALLPRLFEDAGFRRSGAEAGDEETAIEVTLRGAALGGALFDLSSSQEAGSVSFEKFLSACWRRRWWC